MRSRESQSENVELQVMGGIPITRKKSFVVVGGVICFPGKMGTACLESSINLKSQNIDVPSWVSAFLAV